MNKKIGSIIAIAFIVLVICSAFCFVNAFYGNPITKLIVEKNAEKYLANNYSGRGFKTEKPVYNFKFNNYSVRCYIENSIDTHFTISFDKNGKLYNDDYEDRIINGENTINRLSDDFNEYVEGLIKSKLPYDYSILYCYVQVLGKNIFDLDEEFNPNKFLCMNNDEIYIEINDYIYTSKDEMNWDTVLNKLFELDTVLQNNDIVADSISLMLDDNSSEKTYDSFGVHDITRKMIESDNLLEQLKEKYIVDGVMPQIMFEKDVTEPEDTSIMYEFEPLLIKWDGDNYHTFTDFKSYMEYIDTHNWNRIEQINQLINANQYDNTSDEFNDSRMEFIDYLKLETKLNIQMQYGDLPDKCILTDFVIERDGRIKYASTDLMQTELKFNYEGIASIVIKPNPVANVSSSKEDYENGKVIRGIRLSCEFGENKADYLYVFRTDAANDK